MASIYAAHLKHLARSQGAHDAGTPSLIHVPKEEFLLHLPEKAHPEGTPPSVRDLRKTLRGPSER
jgi:hypothetical protein